MLRPPSGHGDADALHPARAEIAFAYPHGPPASCLTVNLLWGVWL